MDVNGKPDRAFGVSYFFFRLFARRLPVGAILTLKMNAAASAPVPFGPNRAFVPLTDGTMIVPPLEKFR